MHEMAIIEALVEQVRQVVPAEAEVISVKLDIGQLEHLDREVMRTAWRATTQGTGLESVALEMAMTPVRLCCLACEETFQPEHHAVFICPYCGVARPKILSGTGVVLREIEFDVPIQEATGP